MAENHKTNKKIPNRTNSNKNTKKTTSLNNVKKSNQKKSNNTKKKSTTLNTVKNSNQKINKSTNTNTVKSSNSKQINKTNKKPTSLNTSKKITKPSNKKVSKVSTQKQAEIEKSVKEIFEKRQEKISIIKMFIVFISITLIVFIGLFIGNLLTNKEQYHELKVFKAMEIDEITPNVTIEDFVGKNNKLSNFFLNIKGYNNNQITHPKVIRFDKKWNGYKYWLAYTPYPYGDSSKENPFIKGSNDLVNFETPKGFENPLDEPEDKDYKNVYNSDTHLVYIEETDTLECYWRYVNNKTNDVIVYKMTTKDGVNWTEKEEFLKSNRTREDYLSPAIIYKDNKYLVWYVDRDFTVKYTEYDTIEQKWGKPRKLNITYKDNENLKSWHLDVIETEKGYEMILVAFENFKNRSNMNLYYTKSLDNEKWDAAKTILKPKEKNGLYRSSLLYINGVYYIHYSNIIEKKERGVSIAYGSDINHLNGLQLFDKQKFIDYVKING